MSAAADGGPNIDTKLADPSALRQILDSNSRGLIMNLLKNILTGVALLPLLPAIALLWLCVWLTPQTSDAIGENENVVNGRKVVRANTNISITLAT